MSVKVEYKVAADVQGRLKMIVKLLDFSHISIERVFSVRSTGSKTRAYARIWGLSRIFQETCGLKPTYVLEVISKYYDKLNEVDKVKVLIHELLHIPQTFSGALKSHRGRYHRVDKREVEKWYGRLRSNIKNGTIF